MHNIDAVEIEENCLVCIQIVFLDVKVGEAFEIIDARSYFPPRTEMLFIWAAFATASLDAF